MKRFVVRKCLISYISDEQYFGRIGNKWGEGSTVLKPLRREGSCSGSGKHQLKLNGVRSTLMTCHDQNKHITRVSNKQAFPFNSIHNNVAVTAQGGD
jgi:hypothetical protein